MNKSVNLQPYDAIPFRSSADKASKVLGDILL